MLYLQPDWLTRELRTWSDAVPATGQPQFPATLSDDIALVTSIATLFRVLRSEETRVVQQAATDSLLEHLSARIADPRFGSLAAAALLFFLPTCVSGMVSPYAIRLLVADRASSGQLAGRLYFVSTFGSAAGTILTSFYLVLYLEVNQILMLMLTVSAIVGVLTWLRPPPAPA